LNTLESIVIFVINSFFLIYKGNLKDFLPFTCDYCEKTFCAEHKTLDAHKCPEQHKQIERSFATCPICQQDGNKKIILKKSFTLARTRRKFGCEFFSFFLNFQRLNDTSKEVARRKKKFQKL
jgi:hypothetical protein